MMTNANDFARAAQQIGSIAVEMRPDDADTYAQSRKLIQYHLQVAARDTRAIAEALAAKEETPA
jgi:hypothetical protein